MKKTKKKEDFFYRKYKFEKIGMSLTTET